MARSLSGTLTTALNSSTRYPQVTMTAEDHIQHYTALQTPATAEAYNAACTAADGSIVRVQLTRGGSGFDQNFQFQRITNPATAAQWTTWTTFTGGSANMFQDGDCAISNNPGGNLRAFAQRGTGGNNLWVWTSTNNGVSWTGPVSVLSPPGGALIAGIGSAGNDDVFFLYQVSGGYNIGRSFISGGIWSALATSPLATILGAAGICVTFLSGVYHVVYSTGYALLSATFTVSGSAWAQLAQIYTSDVSAIGRVSPRIILDSNTGLYSIIFIELDSGAVNSLVYNYPRIIQSADLLHWSAGRIFHDLTETKAANLVIISALSSFTSTIIITMATIKHSALYSAGSASNFKDISASILSYKRIDQIGKPNSIEVLLDNNAGALNSAVGNLTTFKPINGNTTLVLSEGYKTGSPPATQEVIVTGRYHIEKILFQRTPESNQIKIIAHDASRLLDISNRYQNILINQILSYNITEVCARAGFFTPTLPGTAQMSIVVPTFIIQSGQTYRQMLDELCKVYYLEYFLDQTETIIFKELSSGDASVWSYQNEITAVTFGYDDWHANHIIVTGKPPVGGQVGAANEGEAYDDTDITFVGLERIGHIVDRKITTAANCATRASFLMQQEQRTYKEWSIQIPANPALQTIDVVTITDTAGAGGTGLSGTARILQTHTTYIPEQAEFEMKIDLEGV